MTLNGRAQLPNETTLLSAVVLDGIHPSCKPTTELLTQCDLRTQRRSGPGGQHRNKTSSGVFLVHRETGVVSEATERRSQADNRRVALNRLRLKLAIEVRTRSPITKAICDQELELRVRLRDRRVRIASKHEDYPALCALLLNDLHFTGGQPSLVSDQWGVGSSAIVRFLKSYPPLLLKVNAIRQHHDRLPLR